MSITLVPGPEMAMRYNQSLYPVPEEEEEEDPEMEAYRIEMEEELEARLEEDMERMREMYFD